MSFSNALKHTLGFEGGYANDPDDSGGETFRGISRRSFPNWPGWPLIDRAKAAGISSATAINSHFANNREMEKLVTDLYKKEFWEPFDKESA